MTTITTKAVSEDEIKKNLNVEKMLVAKKADLEAEFARMTPEIKKLRVKILNLQNEYRKHHGVPPLTHSDELSLLAQDWSNHLVQKKALSHRSNSPAGENVACFSASSLDAIEVDEMVWLWYQEVNKFNFQDCKWQSGTGHFSQMVWKDSQMLGIGLSFQGNMCMLVCNYFPRGNVMKHYPENVFPRKTAAEKIKLP